MAGFANIGKIPELRKRIGFTLFILLVYRLGVFITVPGVNRHEMQHVVTKGGSGSFLGMFNMFSGNALQHFSIFTVVIMWFGELITDMGIGNGSSMIIFAGIVADMPDAIVRTVGKGSGGISGLTILFVLLLVITTIAAICFFERSHRRIPVQYTKR